MSELNESVSNVLQKAREHVAEVIVGQNNVVHELLIALICDGHVLLEGVPGVAKTLSAKVLARLIDSPFGRIQFTPDLMPSDIIGTNVFDPRTTQFDFRKGPIFASIILADEINRAPAKTQSALFEAMEERQATVDNETYKMMDPFLVVATQNPIEQEGTYRLPEAQLDRFLMKIHVGYPSADEEIEILRRHQTAGGFIDVHSVPPLITTDILATLRTAVRSVTIEDGILGYISALVAATRVNASLELGASPRASIGIMKAAKANAVLDARTFVLPDDVQAVAPSVLRHRIALSAEKEMDGLTPDDVIRMLISSIDVPR